MCVCVLSYTQVTEKCSSLYQTCTPNSFESLCQKVDQNTRGKWLNHSTKYDKDIHAQQAQPVKKPEAPQQNILVGNVNLIEGTSMAVSSVQKKVMKGTGIFHSN